MKSYLALCEDGNDVEELRQTELAKHLEYVETVLDGFQVAGPLREIGTVGIGASCFIYKAETLEDAKRLLTNDPYHAAGIYAQVRWFEFIPAAGDWVGGKNWEAAAAITNAGEWKD